MKSHIPLILLFSLLFCSGCQNNSTQQNDSSDKYESSSKLTVGYNINIETLALLYNLSESGDYHFNVIKGPRATLAKALTHQFENYRQHPAVVKLNALLDEGYVDSYDIILSLYNTPLPEFQQYARYPEVYYENEGLTAEQTQQIFDDFNTAVKQFYIDAHLETALQNNYQSIYKGIMQEVSKVAPNKAFITEAEKYFGIKRDAYEIIVSAFAFNGIGKAQLIASNDKTKAVCLVTSNHLVESDSIDLNAIDQFAFGYADAKYFQEIGQHELIHTFFHEALKQNLTNLSLVDKLEYLFTDTLKNDMAKQGYADWRGCFEEHLVRISEIKIAEKLNLREFVTAYKKECIEERKFIYFEEIYALLNHYESNRNSFENIEAYLPTLLAELEKKFPKN